MSAVHPPRPNRPEWTTSPERCSMFGLRMSVWVALYLGRRIARLALMVVTLYYVLFAPRARRASRSYLARALRRRVGWLDVWRHFYTFASTVLDRVYFLHDRFELFDIDLQGADAAIKQAPNGVLLFGAHFGSFEAIRAAGRERDDLRISVVMYEDNARKTNAVLAAINPKVQRDIVPLGRIDSMLALQQRLDEGGYVGVLVDRSLHDEAMRDVMLLDAQARLPLGPFRLAAILRRPVILMTGMYMGGNRYSIRFEPIADFSNVAPGQRADAVNRAIDRYAERLDTWIREAPYNWFNFFPFWIDDDAPTSRGSAQAPE